MNLTCQLDADDIALCSASHGRKKYFESVAMLLYWSDCLYPTVDKKQHSH
jgi:hypothetical protein